MTDKEYITMKLNEWPHSSARIALGRLIVQAAVVTMGAVALWLLASQVLIPANM